MASDADDLVEQLIAIHAYKELNSYRSNVAFAVRAIENGWLPDENDHWFRRHLEVLGQYLAKNGQPESDNYLLRLGLTVPGMQRGIKPPLLVLDANRGGLSAKRLREAAGQIERWRSALAIGQRFFAALSSHSSEAIVELYHILETKPASTESNWLELFRQLAPEQAKQLTERAIELLDDQDNSVKEIGTSILKRAACFRLPPLDLPCVHALLQRRVYWPSCLYRDSGDTAANQLISKLDAANDHLLNHHLLLALAWTRSDVAYQAFQQWTTRPPDWARILHILPKEYLHSAGYCLDDDGTRCELISKTCSRLPVAAKATGPVVRCRSQISGNCPSCQGPLYCLFDFTQLGEEYFPAELADAPRKVITCLHCACYSQVFHDYSGEGTDISVLEDVSVGAPNDVECVPCIRTVHATACPPFACAEPFSLDDATTLGGIPMWLQYAAYPKCLKCGRVMMFLAQHDNGPLGEEGLYYAFFCGVCSMAAVAYQQT